MLAVHAAVVLAAIALVFRTSKDPTAALNLLMGCIAGPSAEKLLTAAMRRIQK